MAKSAKLKKLLILFIAAALVFSTLPSVSAQENADNFDVQGVDVQDIDTQKLALLKDLGIIAPNFERIYLPDAKITVGEMLSVMQNIIYPNKYGTYDDELAFNDALQTGNFGADKNARYYDNAKYEHVLEAAMNILGYGAIARQNDNYPINYMSLKESSAVLDGINANFGKYIPKKDFIGIIFNVFDAKTLDIDKIGSDFLGFTYKDGDTILKLYQNIETVDGIVEGTAYTKAYDAKSDIAKDKVLIGGALYDNGGIDFSHVVGLKIKAFVYVKDNGYKKIKSYMTDEDISKTEIDGEDIVKYSVFDRRLYYENEKGGEKSVKLSPSAVVLKNGCAISKFTSDTFAVSDGGIKLYDNDGDNVFDAVHITDYTTYVADYVSPDADTVYNLYTYNDGKKILDLEEKDNIKVTVYKDGRQTDKSAIKKDCVLTVANGGEGENKLISVYVSDKSEKGNISEYSSDDDEITLNDVSYKLAKDYIAASDANDKNADGIKLGIPVTVYKDYFGKIAYIKPAGSEYSYGYALYTERERYAKIRLLDEFAVWHTYEFADSVKLNGEKDKVSEKDVYQKLGAESFVPQLVKFRLGTDNKIKEIFTASDKITGAYDEFTVSKEKSGMYQQNNSAFSSKSYLEDEAVIWLLQKQLPTDEEDISIMGTSELFSDRNYTFVQYNADEYGFSKYFAVYDTAENKEYKTNRSGAMVVEKLFKTQGFDGGETFAVRGMMFEYNNISVSFAGDTDLNGIKKGDTISFTTNSDGEISDLKVIHRMSESDVSILPTTIHTAVTYVGGILDKCDFAQGKAKILCGDKVQVLKIAPSTPLIVCEKTNTGVSLTKEQFTSAGIGCYILARVQNSRVANVIIYK